jgi:hypothetical protein
MKSITSNSNVSINLKTFSQLSEWKNIRTKYFREFLPKKIYELVNEKHFKINLQENSSFPKTFSLKKNSKFPYVSSATVSNQSQRSFSGKKRQSMKIKKRLHWNNLSTLNNINIKSNRKSIMMKDFVNKKTFFPVRDNPIKTSVKKRLNNGKKTSIYSKPSSKYSKESSVDVQDEPQVIISDSQKQINQMKKILLDLKNPEMQGMRIFLLDFLKTLQGQNIILNLLSNYYCVCFD